MILQENQQKIESSINNQEPLALTDSVKNNNVGNSISNKTINTTNNQHQITTLSNNDTIKIVTVDDIDIAYKKLGKEAGNPIDGKLFSVDISLIVLQCIYLPIYHQGIIHFIHRTILI